MLRNVLRTLASALLGLLAGDVVLGSLHATTMSGAVNETVLDSLALDLLLVQEGELLGSLDVRHLLDVTLGKDDINLFQRPSSRLGVEEVDDGQEAGVDRGEEQVGSPADVADHDGRHHNNEEVEEPVGASTDSVGLGARLDGVDLGRVQPRERQPCCTERGDVGEQTNGSTLGGTGSTRNETSKGDKHGNTLPDCAVKEELPSANALNQEPGEGGKDRVHNHVDTTHQQGHVVIAGSDRGLEKDGKVVYDY